ncbi:hypothetical protein [Arthrobacter sp. NicSoilB8]|uniref:hypothetical protein n=1 Tax=Arthrobacter sp. NicSoilB8 TaxID=2830998 RepID=UPI001CC7E367|nr:hypothetical protein [Arthrobacter sp. NicSoilB8]BCW69983.1 hypothetical protein NicSoilB8_10270 [Arthrobacter sp. NicSoilB8]
MSGLWMMLNVWRSFRMTNENDGLLDRRVLAAEKYGETMRNWDKVHSAWMRNEASIEEDIVAWQERKAAFDELRRIEEELESEKPVEPNA